MKYPRRWTRWWRVYEAILTVLDALPISDARYDQWAWRIDIWGMDHFGARTDD